MLVCFMLSARGLCDELITRPQEFYRLWCVVVCDLETSRVRRFWRVLGRSPTVQEYIYIYINLCCVNFSAKSVSKKVNTYNKIKNQCRK